MANPLWPTYGLIALLGLLLGGAQTMAQDQAACEPSLTTRGSVLQVHAPEACPIPAEQLQALLAGHLSRAASEPQPRPQSIFLGRVLQYPWLLDALLQAAAASPHWDAVQGAAKDGRNNQLVAQLLLQNDVLQHIRTSLQQAGYELTAVSVEKVLVGSHAELPRYLPAASQGRLPFDAQVWLVIAP